MLVLSRQVDETLIIRTSDGPIRVTLVDIRGNKVRIGIDAPKSVRVDREEIDKMRQHETTAGNQYKNQAPDDYDGE